MPFDETSLKTAAGWLADAKRVVVFTGAGVSAESGIDTFRDNTGLWRRFPPERFATLPGLLSLAVTEPDELARFLRAVLAPIAAARPNLAHLAIARLEHHVETTVVTQNIDGLHQEAGSTRVREIHGTLFDVVSPTGHKVRSLSRAELARMVAALERIERGPFKLPRLVRTVRPLMGLGRGLAHRPRVVLFGEHLAEPDWTSAQEDAAACDLMLVVGTSGEVYPAASLPERATDVGARVVGVGLETGYGDVWLHGKAGELLPRLVTDAFGDDVTRRG